MIRNILMITLFILIGCNDEKLSDKENKVDSAIIQLGDTARYKVVTYNISNNIPFEFYTPMALTSYDSKKVYILLVQSITEFNSIGNSRINLKDYHRFYTPVINSKKEKEVWIYCSCTDNPGLVVDGGECYFNLKINLTKGTYTQIIINALG